MVFSLTILLIIVVIIAVGFWLKNEVGALSRKALKEASEEFLKLAMPKFEKERGEGVHELELKRQAIQSTVEGLSKQLERYENLMEKFETDRDQKYGSLAAQIQQVSKETGLLQKTTADFTAVLGNSRVRGQWGQKMAEDILRACGLQEGIHYTREKELIAGRPDYAFLLPEEHRLFMDVKFPLDNYLKFRQSELVEQQQYYRGEFLKDVRGHIKDMERREYISQTPDSLDYILIFIPNEQVYGMVNEWEPNLIDECLQKRTILCGPWTLYATVRIIWQAWQQYHYVVAIQDIVKSINGFLQDYKIFKGRFSDLGKKLDTVMEKYQEIAHTSYKRLDNRIQQIEEYRKGQRIPEATPFLEDLASVEYADKEE